MQKFAFKPGYQRINRKLIPGNYKLATSEEASALNDQLALIRKVADFYDKISEDGLRLNYAFKDNQGISVLPTKFDKGNFQHLLGIKYVGVSANRFFNALKMDKPLNGTLLVENHDYTFEKLAVLDKLEKITDADTLIITDLSKVGQAKTINFNRALRTNDRDLMLALKDFQVDLYSPRSLLNLTSERAKEKYSHVREKDCVMVYSSEKTDRGIRTNVISTNHNVEMDLSRTTELMVAIGKQAEKEFQEEEERNSLARRREALRRGRDR